MTTHKKSLIQKILIILCVLQAPAYAALIPSRTLSPDDFEIIDRCDLVSPQDQATRIDTSSFTYRPNYIQSAPAMIPAPQPAQAVELAVALPAPTTPQIFPKSPIIIVSAEPKNGHSLTIQIPESPRKTLLETKSFAASIAKAFSCCTCCISEDKQE